MVIGVISDTHGNLAGWQRAWELGLKEAEVIFHCGDLLYHGPKFDPVEGYAPGELASAINGCGKPVLVARGNGDSEVDQLVLDIPIQQPYVFAVIDGMRFLATHGHILSVEELFSLVAKWRIDFLLTGHIHRPVLNKTNGFVHLNPGTVTYPLAKEPELKRRTFAMIRDGRVAIIDIDSGEEVMVQE